MDELISYLRKIRETNKLNREDIAKALNKSPGTYRDIETGRIRLNLEDYLIICKELGIPPTEPLESLNKEKNIILVELTDDELINFRNILNKFEKAVIKQSIKNNNNITIGDHNNINNSFNN